MFADAGMAKAGEVAGEAAAHAAMTGMLIMLVTFTVAMVVYMIPSIIAMVRKHANLASIVVVNICFGWTVIGWAVALVWAFRKK
jgi:hypothetical protein